MPDGHDDLAIKIRSIYHNNIYNPNFRDLFENGGLRFHVDLPRLRAGQVGGSFWSAFVPCPENDTDFSDTNYSESRSYSPESSSDQGRPTGLTC